MLAAPTSSIIKLSQHVIYINILCYRSVPILAQGYQPAASKANVHFGPNCLPLAALPSFGSSSPIAARRSQIKMALSDDEFDGSSVAFMGRSRSPGGFSSAQSHMSDDFSSVPSTNTYPPGTNFGAEFEGSTCHLCSRPGPCKKANGYWFHNNCHAGVCAKRKMLSAFPAAREHDNLEMTHQPQQWRQKTQGWVDLQTRPIARQESKLAAAQFEEVAEISRNEEQRAKIRLNKVRFASFKGFWDKMSEEDANALFEVTHEKQSGRWDEDGERIIRCDDVGTRDVATTAKEHRSGAKKSSDISAAEYIAKKKMITDPQSFAKLQSLRSLGSASFSPMQRTPEKSEAQTLPLPGKVTESALGHLESQDSERDRSRSPQPLQDTLRRRRLSASAAKDKESVSVSFLQDLSQICTQRIMS